MRTVAFFPVLLLGLLLQGPLIAQERASKKPGTALETGFERKLGVIYKSVGQRKLALDIYYPGPGTTKPYPTVVYTHGGGWAAGSRFNAAKGQFAPLFKKLTREGFCIVSVDYRLCRKGGEIRMRDCVIDSKDALRYLVKNNARLGIDPKRVFAFGDSAGGQIAQMLTLTPAKSLAGDPGLTEVDFKIAAGVSWYGPSDFERVDLFNHDDRPDFKDRFAKRIVGEEEPTPDQKVLLYREMSPVRYLTKASPPLLLIQGDKDTTIPVKHAHYMKERAQKLKASVDAIIVKNSGHNWRSVGEAIEPTRDEIVDATVTFLARHNQSPQPSKEARADFYLSPEGSNTWSGTLASPNPEGTDGPFATLERAQDAVRNLKKERKTDITVSIRGGTYYLNQTVVFGLEDSGTAGVSITYAAYEGETPVFSAGKEIVGWKKVSHELPGLPEKAKGKVLEADVRGSFQTLYDAEGILPRARSAG
ncbi:MAG: alpha/beta hydrolase, partial [Verrucomicrobiota bacterium]